MTEEQRKNLMIVYNTLNVVTVTGKENLIRIAGCMDLIETILKGEEDGNAHPELKS